LPETISAAIHSAETGILDSHAYYLSLLGDIEAAGGAVAYYSEVVSGRVQTSSVHLTVRAEEEYVLEAATVINAAGLQAIEIATAIDGPHVVDLPKARFAKGHYFSVSGETPFRRLIYPLPNKAGLGTHLTLDLGGRGRIGPDVAWLSDGSDEPFDYAVPDQLATAFHQAALAFWPDLRLEQLSPDYAGIRPKLVGPGDAPGDFVIQKVTGGHLINLLGIESPGLTSALAIGAYVAQLTN
jgi:L-2-hydroxyglutarate oxidase LhgO